MNSREAVRARPLSATCFTSAPDLAVGACEVASAEVVSTEVGLH